MRKRHGTYPAGRVSLFRKLRESVWIDMERGDDFEEYVIIR